MVAGIGLAMAMLLATPVAEAGTDEPGGAHPGRFITEFPITAGAGATFATAGPDGNVWFAELAGNRIGRVTPAGTVTEFPLPVPQSAPLDITVGPDGNISDGYVPPRRSCPDSPPNAIDELAFRPQRRPTRLHTDRQQRLQHHPLRIGQITPTHHKIISEADHLCDQLLKHALVARIPE
jgi:hypothetical protein